MIVQRKCSSEQRVSRSRFAWFARSTLIAVTLFAATACDRTARNDVRDEAAIQSVATSADSRSVATPPADGLATCTTERHATAASPSSDLMRRSPSGVEVQPPLLRAAVFIDQSESMGQARVPHVSGECLTPLLDRLQSAGGELAVGLIRDRSDAPLARVFVPEPPAAPVFPPRESTNIFEKARERKHEDEERARYEAQQREWRADAATRINAFAESIAPLFDAAADAPATDIHSALLRADVFVSEPNAFGRPVTNVVILLTDGVETVDAEMPAQFGAPAELLVVNGTGTLGQLEPLHPVRFEALDAAIRYVVDGGSHVRR